MKPNTFVCETSFRVRRFEVEKKKFAVFSVSEESGSGTGDRFAESLPTGFRFHLMRKQWMNHRYLNGKKGFLKVLLTNISVKYVLKLAMKLSENLFYELH